MPIAARYRSVHARPSPRQRRDGRTVTHVYPAPRGFNPSFRRRNDLHAFGGGSDMISIHAPLRGATRVIVISMLKLRISIHAPIVRKTFKSIRDTSRLEGIP